LDFTIRAFLDIQHPVSNFEHLPGKCNRQEFSRMSGGGDFMQRWGCLLDR
jgi:hypothetical protein